MNARWTPTTRHSDTDGGISGPDSTLWEDCPPPRPRSQWNARHGSLYPIQELARGVSPHRAGRTQGPTTPLPPHHARPHVNFMLTPLQKTPRMPITPMMHAPSARTDGTPPQELRPDTHDHTNAAKFFPAIPPYTRHPSQSPPTPVAMDIFNDLLLRPTTDWTLEDFNTPTESTRASVLLSLFIDFAHAKRPGGLTSS
jgi:hypothetical protein